MIDTRLSHRILTEATAVATLADRLVPDHHDSQHKSKYFLPFRLFKEGVRVFLKDNSEETSQTVGGRPGDCSLRPPVRSHKHTNIAALTKTFADAVMCASVLV